VKTVLSVLLGLMLLTSLVGISYATPIVQPAQNNGGNDNACVNLSPNNPNYISLGCGGAAHQNGNNNPPAHGCASPGARVGPDFCCFGQKADSACCTEGRVGPDITCCGTGITPHSLEVSDIQADNVCNPV
jgi:hypothetical protein